MKATGIVRRVDDLGRIVIPKEIRRTLKIREGDPSQTTPTPIDRFCMAIHSVIKNNSEINVCLAGFYVPLLVRSLRYDYDALGELKY